jgi:hypothetical protein
MLPARAHEQKIGATGTTRSHVISLHATLTCQLLLVGTRRPDRLTPERDNGEHVALPNALMG